MAGRESMAPRKRFPNEDRYAAGSRSVTPPGEEPPVDEDEMLRDTVSRSLRKNMENRSALVGPIDEPSGSLHEDYQFGEGPMANEPDPSVLDEPGGPASGETGELSENLEFGEGPLSNSAKAAKGGKAEPGTYTAEGDPYTYRVNDDGSVTIADGPTGEGTTLTKGAAYDAIYGQITSGQLTASKMTGETTNASIEDPGAYEESIDADEAMPGSLRDAARASLRKHMGEDA